MRVKDGATDFRINILLKSAIRSMLVVNEWYALLRKSSYDLMNDWSQQSIYWWESLSHLI